MKDGRPKAGETWRHVTRGMVRVVRRHNDSECECATETGHARFSDDFMIEKVTEAKIAPEGRGGLSATRPTIKKA